MFRLDPIFWSFHQFIVNEILSTSPLLHFWYNWTTLYNDLHFSPYYSGITYFDFCLIHPYLLDLITWHVLLFFNLIYHPLLPHHYYKIHPTICFICLSFSLDPPWIVFSTPIVPEIISPSSIYPLSLYPRLLSTLLVLPRPLTSDLCVTPTLCWPLTCVWPCDLCLGWFCWCLCV